VTSAINRYYDPATGEFISVDPDVAVTGQPYAYASDDPVDITDPTGRDDTEGLYHQGSLFADGALSDPAYFDYGSWNDLTTAAVNFINAPFVGVYHAYVNLYEGGEDGCGWSSAIGLANAAVVSDIEAFLFLDGDEGDEGLVNLASPQETQHVLYSDANGGGHLWPGAPGKTPFPASWSGEQVMHAVSDVVTSPASEWSREGGVDVITGTYNGVNMRIVYDPSDNRLLSAYPTNLPRNP
jgi:hypothetical protein